MKNILITLLILTLFYGTANAEDNIALEYNLKLGVNLSRPISIPNSIKENGGINITYLPGYNWEALFKLTKKRIGIVSGVGFKNLKFDFERNIIGPNFSKSTVLIRINYIYIPFKIEYYINKQKQYYLSIGGEYCKLIDDVNFEVFQKKNFDRRLSTYREIYYWIKEDNLFLDIGLGKQLKNNFSILCELGFTPINVGVNQEPLEGDYYGTNFNFSKKLLEFRISVNYNFSNTFF